MPITFITFLVSTLSISGIPFTSGFLSKDSILASTMAFANLNGGITIIIPIIAFTVAGMTAFYMFLLVIKTFLGEPKNKEKYDHCHESPKQMTIPLIILTVLSIWIFYSFNPINSEGWFSHMLKAPESMVVGNHGSVTHVVSSEEFAEAVHHSHYPAMGLSVLLAGIGILIAFTFYFWKKVNTGKLQTKFNFLYKFSICTCSKRTRRCFFRE